MIGMDLMETFDNSLPISPEPVPLHFNAPRGYKCSDCQIDQVACPECYAAWWKAKFPHNMRFPQPVSPLTICKLLSAAKAAKDFLIKDLEEPGRSVFWKLVDAIRETEGKSSI